MDRLTRTRGRAAALAAIVLATSLASACGSDARRTGPRPAAFRENITTWSRPLDAYSLPDTTVQYAQSLVYAACMRKAGHRITVVDPAEYVPANVTKQGYKLFDLDIAQNYGYHNAPTRSTPLGAQPGEDTPEAGRCTATANKAIANPYADFVQNLRAAAYESSLHASAVGVAARRWHDCMLPLGLADLPGSPADMPTLRLAKQWGLSGPSDPAADTVSAPTRPTVPEIRVATADARCRESSRYTATLYRAQVSAQQKLVTRNDDKLAAAYGASRAQSAAVARTLQRYGR